MNQANKPFKTIFVIFMLAGSLWLPAQATKLVAEPLPHRADTWADNSQHVAPSVSRFYSTEATQKRTN